MSFLNALAWLAIVNAILMVTVSVHNDKVNPFVEHMPPKWAVPSALIGILWLIFG